MKKIILATLGAGLLAVGINANAAKEIESIRTTVEIVGTCSVTLEGQAAFDSVAANTITSEIGEIIDVGQLIVDCPNAYLIGADNGYYGDHTNYRHLKDPQIISHDISYNLLADGNIFGDQGLNTVDNSYAESFSQPSLPSTNGVSSATHNLSVQYYLTGSEPVGSYTDVITVTLAW